MSKYFNDLIAAASGGGSSGHGCYCPKGMDSGGDGAGGLLGGLDLGTLAAGAIATFILYQQIITLMMRRRKKRESSARTTEIPLIFQGTLLIQ